MIHDSVCQSLQESRAEMLQKHHIKATPVSFQKGDVDFKHPPEHQSKLTPKFCGPITVKEQSHGNKIKIFNPSKTTEVVHAAS